ncbi:11100_t:CDS:2, partial [Rhizophagus irregularis]
SQQHGISFEDMQKAIQNALAQQKTEYQSLLKKQKADFQSQMVQQTKKILPPVPPKNMEQLLDTYESANPIPDILTKEEIMRVIAKTYGPPPKPQKPEKLISLNDQSRKPFYC